MAAYSRPAVRDGLEMIGLGLTCHVAVRGRSYSTDEAFETLARLEDRIGENRRAEIIRARKAGA
ncbi:hypothetical protein D3C72_2465830 [compost metagenome]